MDNKKIEYIFKSYQAFLKSPVTVIVFLCIAVGIFCTWSYISFLKNEYLVCQDAANKTLKVYQDIYFKELNKKNN